MNKSEQRPYTAIFRAMRHVYEEDLKESPENIVHRLEIGWRRGNSVYSLLKDIRLYGEFENDDFDCDNIHYGVWFTRLFQSGPLSWLQKFRFSLREKGLDDKFITTEETEGGIKLTVSSHGILDYEGIADILSAYVSSITGNGADDAIRVMVNTYDTEYLDFEDTCSIIDGTPFLESGMDREYLIDSVEFFC